VPAPKFQPVWRSETVLPVEVADELARAARERKTVRRTDEELAARLSAAAEAYQRDRYADALRISRALLVSAPGSMAVRELHGLACYRLGRWEDAIRHLELVVSATGEPNQIPVLMDCHRALGRHRRVEQLWLELKGASPDVDVLVEGRLVLASTRAQRGDLAGAIHLLVSAGAGRAFRHPADRHVRQWYLLADLMEASGDVPRARELFERVVRVDPDLADAADRLAALGRAGRKRSRRPRESGG
jgi:tetratricopeptide (TPR) repeat protein